jgi:hypothetical protein
MAQFNAQSVNDAAKFNAASANEMARTNIDSALKAGIINQEQANRMAQFNAEQANAMTRFDVQNDSDVAKFNASESNALTKLGIDANNKAQLAKTEADYKVLMQTSAGAADVYKQFVNNVAGILSSKDMSAQAKTDAVANIQQILNASLGVLGDIAGMDLGELTMTGGEPGVSQATPTQPAPAPAGQPGGLIDYSAPYTNPVAAGV